MNCYLKDKNKPSLLFHFDIHLFEKNHCSCSALRKEPKRNKSLSVLLKQQWYFQSLVLVEVKRKNCLKSHHKDFLLLSCCLESMNSVHIQNIPNHIDFLSSHHLCQTIQQGQVQSEVTFLFPFVHKLCCHCKCSTFKHTPSMCVLS